MFFFSVQFQFRIFNDALDPSNILSRWNLDWSFSGLYSKLWAAILLKISYNLLIYRRPGQDYLFTSPFLYFAELPRETKNALNFLKKKVSWFLYSLKLWGEVQNTT